MSGLSRESISQYKGIIGERLAEKYLRKHGFEVDPYWYAVDMVSRLHGKWFDRDSETDPPDSVKLFEKFIGSKEEDLKKMIQAIKNIDDGEEHVRRTFDFLAKKDDQYYVIEVKTNKARLPEVQRRNLELAKKFGFIPLVMRTKVNIIAKSEDILIHKL